MKTNIIDENIIGYIYEKNSLLYWAVDKNYNALKHSLAGHLNKNDGYLYITINGKTYPNHRILYQIYKNEILTEDDRIDHINGIKTDNRKENLRKSSNEENCRNRKAGKNNKSTGIKNIYYREYDNYDVYVIQIRSKSKTSSKEYHVDKFSLDDVIEIRNRELIRLHGEFARFD